MSDDAGAWADPEWRERELARITGAADAIIAKREEYLRAVLDDYDRRRAHWWGRTLLWLLRKTT